MGKTEKNHWGQPITRDLSGVERLRKLRGVKTFADFPEGTKAVYMEVAKCFPGVQVWAVGSRVRGDYVDKEPSRGDWERHDSWVCSIIWRERAGMKFKEESDYDFLVSPDAVQVGELPPNTERVRCRIPEGERITVPIFKTKTMKAICNNCKHEATIEISQQDDKCGFPLGWVCDKCRFVNSIAFRDGEWKEQTSLLGGLSDIKTGPILLDSGDVPDNFY